MRFITFICIAIMAMTANAQQKKEFTLEELNFGGKNYHTTLPQRVYTTWNGETLIKQDVETLDVFDTKKGTWKTLLSADKVKEILNADNLGYFASFYNTSFTPEGNLNVMTKTHDVVLDIKAKKVISSKERVKTGANRDVAPSTGYVAYTKDRDLYIHNGNKEIRLSNEKEGVLVGQSVHRNEFGISKGTFWSPKGDKLAYYRMDESMVTDYPLVEIENRVAEHVPEKYPMAGMTSHKVTVGIYDTESDKTTWLELGDVTDRYFTNISWSPDESELYLIELNRDQNHAMLQRYDVKTGKKIDVLYEETHPKYVEPSNPVTFLPWNEREFIYQSQKDGFNHLYVYNLDTREMRQLTSGEWVVKSLVGFDAKNRKIFIRSNEVSPIQMDIFSVDYKTGKRTRLTEGDGIHTAVLSPDGSYLADSFSSPETVLCQSLINTRTGKSYVFNTPEDPWNEYRVPEMEIGTIKAADGKTDLYYRLVKPLDFDPNKKYPTIVYVYGGPHAHNVELGRHYGVRAWDVYMATKGYVMFCLDNRGSENRGLEFENATFRHLGDVEMKDQMEGVKFLKSLPFVDADRMGVHGWSFGGFMTTNLMVSYPDTFKAGVAGGPVIDWKLYEVMYGERYMDTPQSNPEGYDGSNLCLKAKNLKGRLQIIFGYNDPVCIPQHTLSFLRACIDAGTQPDLFTYPSQPHNMMGHDSVHLHERITRYFEDYLK